MVGVAVAGNPAPTVFAVGMAGAETFLIARVYRLPKRVSAVLIDFVVGAATIVTVDRSGVEVRIVVKVEPALANTPLLITEMLVVLFLKAILRHAPLLLQD